MIIILTGDFNLKTSDIHLADFMKLFNLESLMNNTCIDLIPTNKK